MYLLLVILMVIASILMCFIVLIQNSKGGGLASVSHHPIKSWVYARLLTFWKRQHGVSLCFWW